MKNSVEKIPEKLAENEIILSTNGNIQFITEPTNEINVSSSKVVFLPQHTPGKCETRKKLILRASNEVHKNFNWQRAFQELHRLMKKLNFSRTHH